MMVMAPSRVEVFEVMRSGYVLKTDPIRFANALGMESKKKRDFRMTPRFGSEELDGCRCSALKWGRQ